MNRLLGSALVILIGLCASPLSASTFVAMTESELIAQSDLVIQGEVINTRSHWSQTGRIIVTDATIRVDEALLGDSPRVIQVRTIGGQVNDFVVEATGFPKLEMGEKVLLFLHEEPADRSLRITGHQQGQFRVVTRLDGVTLAVPQVDEDAALLRANGTPVPAQRSVEIGSFKTHLLDAAEKLGRANVDGKR